MKKILCWDNKDTVVYLEADTDKKRDLSYYKLFKFMDGEAYYSDLDYDLEHLEGDDKRERKLLISAREGDMESARKLIQSRSKFQYERVWEDDLLEQEDEL